MPHFPTVLCRLVCVFIRAFSVSQQTHATDSFHLTEAISNGMLTALKNYTVIIRVQCSGCRILFSPNMTVCLCCCSRVTRREGPGSRARAAVKLPARAPDHMIVSSSDAEQSAINWPSVRPSCSLLRSLRLGSAYLLALRASQATAHCS